VAADAAAGGDLTGRGRMAMEPWGSAAI